MSEIRDWSTSAGGNTAAPPDGWPENTMTFGQVNNSAREMMAVISRWYYDTSGILLATMPSTNNYALTLNRAISSYTLDLRLRFRAPAVNTGPATLNVNGLGARSIRMPDGSALRNNDLTDVVDVYYHGSDAWLLNNLPRRAVGEFVGGGVVSIIFAMASAPTGWVQNTSPNDRVLRIVSGVGTSFGGSWTISGISTQTANHTHTFSVSVSGTANVSGTTSGPSGTTLVESGNDTVIVSNAHSHTFSQSAPVSASGSATTSTETGSHAHVFDGAWRPAYFDVIMCGKA